MKFPKNIGMVIHRNEPALYYETVKKSIDKGEDRGTDPDYFESVEEMNKAIENNEIWTCQWYPDTPIGCFIVAASTLEECIAYALRVEAEQNGE